MRAEKYIVIGIHDSERNSYMPDGDIRRVQSGHRIESQAWQSAHRAHYELGGCDGSDSLTKVMVRFCRVNNRKRNEIQEYDDTYEHNGWIYTECDFWAAHTITHDGLGLVACVRRIVEEVRKEGDSNGI